MLLILIDLCSYWNNPCQCLDRIACFGGGIYLDTLNSFRDNL